jgi:adenylate cyclase
LSDNLEARLVLLQKRLAERHTGITLTKTGRGCFELNVQGALVLTSA